MWEWERDEEGDRTVEVEELLLENEGEEMGEEGEEEEEEELEEEEEEEDMSMMTKPRLPLSHSCQKLWARRHHRVQERM